MSKDEIKVEITKYVQALETSYTEAIKEMKICIDREKNEKRKVLGTHGTAASMRSEME